MTESELLQNILYMRELANSDMIDFITTLFAFTVMAHFFGNTLSRAVAIMASIVYSIFATLTILSLLDLTISKQRLIDQLHAESSGASEYMLGGNWPPIIGVMINIGPLIVTWLLSLYYFHLYIRRGKGGHE